MAARHSQRGANLVTEIIGTFVLIFVVASIFSKEVAGTGGITRRG